jgi:prepilin peptidase CpaA
MNSYIYGLVLLELTIVSWMDIKTKKILNYWFMINVILSFIFHLIFPQLYPWTWAILIFPAGSIVLGFLFFLMNIMGAGDSKYLASLFLLLPLEQHMLFFENVLVSTMVVGFILLSFTIVRNFSEIKAYSLTAHWVGLKERIRSHFSYAPVILLAWTLLGWNLWK